RTGRTRTIPTTRRGAVPGVADQTGLSKHALVQDFVWDTGTQVHATYAVDPGYPDSWSLTF
ncbi:hypothetical protein ACFXC8_51350, partial [Streptomyces sp. NPDC059441]|uniref:hypothetical protein n=1 Tax=Streptomyces sp. NPDC059441 TaxID=3346829 RepID=UPI0036772A2A